MREIKFRGKAQKDNKWYVGYYGKTVRNNIDIIYIDTIPEIKSWGSTQEHIIIIPETVGQFTGKTDKNGKEIFEGDILSEEGYLFIVVFDSEYAKFKLQHIGAIQYPEWNRGVRMEIIGNIHDNHELIK